MVPGRRIGRHGIGCDALHQLRERGSARGAGGPLCAAHALPEQAGEIAPLAAEHKKDVAIVAADLLSLGVVWADYPTLNYLKTQQIGAAVAFLGCDGLIAPSARWACENLMLISTNHAFESELRVVSSEEVALKEWAREHQFLVEEAER
jgi:RES domain